MSAAEQSKQAHTPGPWRWDEDTDPYSQAMPRLVGADCLQVCNFGDGTQYYPTEGDPPREADARLIAAAPDLLAALRMARTLMVEIDGYEVNGPSVTVIDAAIAKALGSAA